MFKTCGFLWDRLTYKNEILGGKNMKYVMKILAGCAICFISVLAGLQFAKGNIGIGIFDLCLATLEFPFLIKDLKD